MQIDLPKKVVILSLLNTLDTQHNDCRVKFMRSMANTLTTRCIGTAQRLLRQNERAEKLDDGETPTLDKRNEMDHFIESADAEARRRDDLGFAPNIDLNAQLRLLVAARDYFAGETVTAADNRFDYPMTFAATLDFMTKGTGQAPKPEVVKAIAEATGLEPDAVAKLHHGAQRKRADQLKLDQDAIIDLIGSLSSKDGSENAFDELDPVVRHRLITTASRSYQRGIDRLAESIMMGRSTELSTLAVLNKAKPAIVEFVDQFEEQYQNDLLEASDRNVNFEDIRQVLNMPKKVKTEAKPAKVA